METHSASASPVGEQAAALRLAQRLLAHFDFLPSAFQQHGLPLCLHVDYHSFFFTHTPEAFTPLGAALAFYEVNLRSAPTPQAKGQIERAHQFWQKRLPALFAALFALSPYFQNHRSRIFFNCQLPKL